MHQRCLGAEARAHRADQHVDRLREQQPLGHRVLHRAAIALHTPLRAAARAAAWAAVRATFAAAVRFRFLRGKLDQRGRAERLPQLAARARLVRGDEEEDALPRRRTRAGEGVHLRGEERDVGVVVRGRLVVEEAVLEVERVPLPHVHPNDEEVQPRLRGSETLGSDALEHWSHHLSHRGRRHERAVEGAA